MDHPAVERFIRDTLGCGCPPEVFNDLRLEPPDGMHDGAIHVGGRLLVLLLGGDALPRLPALLAAGRKRRDSEGYNRVRFVLVTDDPASAEAAQTLFRLAPDRDERTHLHVISPKAIPPLN